MYRNEKYKVISVATLFLSALFSAFLFMKVAYWGMPGYKIGNVIELFAFAVMGITLLTHNKKLMTNTLYVLAAAYIIKTVYSIIFRAGGVWRYVNYWHGHYFVLYLYIVSCAFATVSLIFVAGKINDKRDSSIKQVITLCGLTIALGIMSYLYAVKVGAFTHHFLNFNFVGWIGIALMLLTIYGYDETPEVKERITSAINSVSETKTEPKKPNKNEDEDLRRIELLNKYHELLSKGAISQSEYDAKKAELLELDVDS